MSKQHILSDESLKEKSDDLLFSKVMALYCEEESEKILQEMREAKTPTPEETEQRLKEINQLMDAYERKAVWGKFFSVSKKILNTAAVFFFVVFFSLSSVVVASADVREQVKEALYYLIYDEDDRYTTVTFAPSDGFIDPELYDWEGAYAPTYMPEGYVFENKNDVGSQKQIKYVNEFGDTIFFFQLSNTASAQIDTENADSVEEITINGNAGFLSVKDKFTSIIWSNGEVAFILEGTCDKADLLQVAKSIEKFG